MKKIISLLLATILAFGLLAGCSAETSNSEKPISTDGATYEGEGNKPTVDSEDGESTVPTEPEREKLPEQVFRSSDFSEGLAAVVVGGRDGRKCIINKKGEIVADIDVKLDNTIEIEYVRFSNGYSYFYGGILDKNGKLTYPENVGASRFYTVALDAGYIIAEVVEADYSSTKKMLGVMDTQFEWVVQPTEELHAAMSNRYGGIGLSYALNTEDYYYQGYVYVADIGKCLNVETGEIVDYEAVGFEHPSFTWTRYTDGSFGDYEENIRLDLSKYENINPYLGNGFNDEIALIGFVNSQANTTYFTVIDEKGNFLFEPVDFKENEMTSIGTDGNTILVSYSKSAEELMLKSYDMQGNLISEFNTKSIGKYCSYSATINDGVVVIDGGYNYSNYVWYYTPSFEPLF